MKKKENKKPRKKRVRKEQNNDFMVSDYKINCYDFSDEIYVNVKPKDYLDRHRGYYVEE